MKPKFKDAASLIGWSNNYWQICTLYAALELDLFTVLADQSVVFDDVVRRTGCSSDGLRRVLDALVFLGILQRDGELYQNSEISRVYLSKHSETYVGYILLHHQQMMAGWQQLAQSVITGQPIQTDGASQHDHSRESFLLGMDNLAALCAPKLAGLIDLSEKRQLLDLGGGPGTFAVHFCRAYPELRATVFDLPETRSFAEQTIAEHGLAERIAFQSGDYNIDPIKGSFDVVWMSHILHSESLTDCTRLLEKTAAVLKPGAVVAIHEFLLSEDTDGPAFPALFSLAMLFGTPGGRTYSEAQLTEMLQQINVRNIRKITYGVPTGAAVLMGQLQK